MARGWGIRKPFDRHQEAYERERFEKDREAFNSHRMQYERQNRGKVGRGDLAAHGATPEMRCKVRYDSYSCRNTATQRNDAMGQ